MTPLAQGFVGGWMNVTEKCLRALHYFVRTGSKCELFDYESSSLSLRHLKEQVQIL